MKLSGIITLVAGTAVLAAPAAEPLRQAHKEPTCQQAYNDCERGGNKLCCPYNGKCRTLSDQDCKNVLPIRYDQSISLLTEYVISENLRQPAIIKLVQKSKGVSTCCRCMLILFSMFHTLPLLILMMIAHCIPKRLS
jgi:hypothetical protein